MTTGPPDADTPVWPAATSATVAAMDHGRPVTAVCSERTLDRRHENTDRP